MSEVINKIYTEPELCEHLGVSRETLRKFRNEGKLGFTRVGLKIRYTQKHVDDYLARNEISPTKRLLKKAS